MIFLCATPCPMCSVCVYAWVFVGCVYVCVCEGVCVHLLPSRGDFTLPAAKPQIDLDQRDATGPPDPNQSHGWGQAV